MQSDFGPPERFLSGVDRRPVSFRLHPGKACLIEVKIIDKRVEKAVWIIAIDIIMDPSRQELGLVAIAAFNMVHAAILTKWCMPRI
jgi:hypothetical protein